MEREQCFDFLFTRSLAELGDILFHTEKYIVDLEALQNRATEGIAPVPNKEVASPDVAQEIINRINEKCSKIVNGSVVDTVGQSNDRVAELSDKIEGQLESVVVLHSERLDDNVSLDSDDVRSVSFSSHSTCPHIPTFDSKYSLSGVLLPSHRLLDAVCPIGSRCSVASQDTEESEEMGKNSDAESSYESIMVPGTRKRQHVNSAVHLAGVQKEVTNIAPAKKNAAPKRPFTAEEDALIVQRATSHIKQKGGGSLWTALGRELGRVPAVVSNRHALLVGKGRKGTGANSIQRISAEITAALPATTTSSTMVGTTTTASTTTSTTATNEETTVSTSRQSRRLAVTWSCVHCTFENPAALIACCMCGQRRAGVTKSARNK